MPPTLIVAAIAALAILLIAVGIASAGSGTGVTARLERYASGKQEPKKGDALGGLARRPHRPERRDRPAQQGRRAARLRGQPRPRPRPRRPEAQGQRVPLHLGRRRSSASRSRCTSSASSCRPSRTRSSSWSAPSSASSCRAWYVQRRKGKRLNAFNKQLPDTITLIANALRAGSSFLQAIELVVREARPPISTEFERVIREVNLGLPFDQALENMVRRVRSDDLELMVDRDLDPAPGRRQPRRDPRLDRLHDPRADPHQGRDPDADRAAAAVRLRRRVPADRPRPASCSSLAPSFMEPMFDADGRRPGDPGRRSSSSASAGFMMFIGFMFIRRIVDIEV